MEKFNNKGDRLLWWTDRVIETAGLALFLSAIILGVEILALIVTR
tara:strand:- start:435 stop:569 length:135 start_codon:yes stop_codon:yes gene_type:complete